MAIEILDTAGFETLLLSRGFDYLASTMRALPAFTLLALLVTGSTAFAQTEGTSPPLPALPPPDPTR